MTHGGAASPTLKLTNGDKTMHLRNYPKAIAAQQTQLDELRRDIRQVRELITANELSIDKVVIFDETLKNEGQRKIRRAELIQGEPDLLALLARLSELDDQRAVGEIELNRLINQLAIAKLEKRQTIAQMETEARLAS
jgi:hypothetical protein